MVNIHDLAHNLARALKQSPENRAFQEARSQIKGDTKAESLLKDFQKKQLELQALQLNGQEPSEAQKQALEQLYQVLSMNPKLATYLQAEFRLGQLLTDIQKILANAVELPQ